MEAVCVPVKPMTVTSVPSIRGELVSNDTNSLFIPMPFSIMPMILLLSVMLAETKSISNEGRIPRTGWSSCSAKKRPPPWAEMVGTKAS